MLCTTEPTVTSIAAGCWLHDDAGNGEPALDVMQANRVPRLPLGRLPLLAAQASS